MVSRKKNRRFCYSASLVFITGLTACSFAPKYIQALVPTSAQYKETGKWLKVQSPISITELNQPWWTLYHDRTLNALEQQVSCNNQNLQIALARYQQAMAYAQSVNSEKYPTIKGIGTIARQKNSSTVALGTAPFLYNTFLLAADLNYEIDAWGRVQNSIFAANRQAQASKFDLDAINLSLHALLASDYFKLRSMDRSQRLLDKTVIAYQKALNLTQHRYKGGIAAIADVDQAMTQLENAKTLATDIRLQRAQLEHAIAVLIGEAPGLFTLKPQTLQFHPVIVTPELPSSLMQRRPDIAATEQRVQAANATIGVAKAAFFPQFNLISLLGFQSSQIGKLFSAPSLFWSLGPSTALSLIQPEISLVLFDGYKLQAQLKQAKASYFEAVSTYRQTVLTAFQEVEDALVALRRLKEESQTQTRSTRAARQAWFQEAQRYKGGIVTFLEVVITENEALQAELALIKIQTRYQLSTLQLIQALGGGWGDIVIK